MSSDRHALRPYTLNIAHHEWLTAILSAPGQFNIARLKAQGWQCLPAESALHLDEDDIARLLTLAKAQDLQHLYALRAEPLAQVPEALELDLHAKALQAFSQEYGHFDWVLTPADQHFAIFCSNQGYLVYAGPPATVEALAGVSSEQAFETFESWLQDNGLKALQPVLAACRQDSASGV